MEEPEEKEACTVESLPPLQAPSQNTSPAREVKPAPTGRKEKRQFFREPVFEPISGTMLKTGIMATVSFFIIYVLTLCPSVPPKDSGELITAAACLGVAHMPGYPLFVLLGKLFSLIPLGNVAWRLNLMSAFFNTLALFVVYLFVARATGRLYAALATILMLGFSYMFWLYSIFAEVFALNNFLVTMLVYLAFDWREKALRHTSLPVVSLGSLALCAGLAFTNHQSAVLVFPLLFFIIITVQPSMLLRTGSFFSLLGFFAAGFSLNLVMIPLALRDPYINWGNPCTLQGLLCCLQRTDYGTLSLTQTLPPLAPSLAGYWSQVMLFFGLSTEYMSTLILVLALIGLVYLLENKPTLACALSCGLLFTGPFFVFLSRLKDGYAERSVLEKFMNAPSVFWALFAGFGVFFLVNAAEVRLHYLLKKPVAGKILHGVLIAALGAWMLAFSLPRILVNSNYCADDYGRNIFDTFDRDALFITTGDTPLFVAWYLQGVEKVRPDVIIISLSQFSWRALQTIERHPDLFDLPELPKKERAARAKEVMGRYNCTEEFVADIVARNVERHPIYVDVNSRNEFKVLIPYMVPQGAVFRILKDRSGPAQLKFMDENRKVWNGYRAASLAKIQSSREQMMHEFLFIYAEAHSFAGVIYGMNGRYGDAEREFLEALRLIPGSPAYRANLEKARRDREAPRRESGET